VAATAEIPKGEPDLSDTFDAVVPGAGSAGEAALAGFVRPCNYEDNPRGTLEITDRGRQVLVGTGAPPAQGTTE